VITWVNELHSHTSNELKQVVTDTHYLNVLETMNKCDWCNKELTASDHPDCCSDCWQENAQYYE
jgi:hypothetical protein